MHGQFEHQNTMVPALRLPSDPFFGETKKIRTCFNKGDFLRVRNIVLSYSFSPKVLNWLREVNSLSLGVSAENLALFTRYPGFDTEIGVFNTEFGQSVDFYAYPRPTTITANLKITF